MGLLRGHGIHKPGGGFDAYPVLVPADVMDLQDYLWVPSPSMFGFKGDEPLVRFTPDELPRAQLRVLVEPAEAIRSAAAALRVRSPATGRLIREEPQGPPLVDGAVWDLLYRLHRVEVEAPGFEPWATLVDLVADTTKLAALTRAQVVRGAGLETLSGPEGADEAGGRIVARSADPLTLVELVDASGEQIAAAHGTLSHDVGEGAYRRPADTRRAVVG